jgi:hypothetical protein
MGERTHAQQLFYARKLYWIRIDGIQYMISPTPLAQSPLVRSWKLPFHRGLAALEIGLFCNPRSDRSTSIKIYSIVACTKMVLGGLPRVQKKQRVDWRGAREGQIASEGQGTAGVRYIRPRRRNFEVLPTPQDLKINLDTNRKPGGGGARAGS